MSAMAVENFDTLAVLANLEQVFLEKSGNGGELPAIPGLPSLGRPPSFGDWIANELIHEIIRGDLRSGSPVREIDLATRFKTSRTPVREAIRMLVGYGLLDAHTHRSHVVRPLTESEATLISQARLAIEPPIARLAAQRLEGPVRDQMAGLQVHFDAAVVSDDRYRFFALLARIQTLKAMACGNRYLISMMTSIAHSVARVRFLSVEDEEPLKQKMIRLQAHLDALLQGAPEAAEEAMVRSVTHSWASLRTRFGSSAGGAIPETIEMLALRADVDGISEGNAK